MENKYNYNWIKEEYEGIYGIYPSRCLNFIVFQKVMNDFTKDGYKLYRIFNDYIRAIK